MLHTKKLILQGQKKMKEVPDLRLKSDEEWIIMLMLVLWTLLENLTKKVKITLGGLIVLVQEAEISAGELIIF